MLRAIFRRFQSASRLIDHLSNVSFVLAQVGTGGSYTYACARAHTHTHTHTHTHKSSQIFHPGSSLVSPSISFPVLKPSIWVDSPPPRWPSFPSPGFVECVFPHDVGEAAQAHGPALGLLSLREPGLRPPPQHIRSMVPRKFVHGSLFSDTSYLFL